MIINVYLYGASMANDYLTLTSGDENFDCILIGITRYTSDNSPIAQNQSGRVLTLGGNIARVNVESVAESAGIYNIKRYSFIGNFNKDALQASVQYNRQNMRIEIRNEYGVLIWDNGLPLPDGTYPPDAKNRAGLAGLHAAPAVINPELEAALTGDATNKEEKLTGAERGAGMQYALERNEDNGL